MAHFVAILGKYKFTIGVICAVLVICLADAVQRSDDDVTFGNETQIFDDVIDPMGKFMVHEDLNTFLLDGEPFRYVSGSFHYWRSTPETWRAKLELLKAGGLNAVDIYIYWGLHNPQDGVYNFDGFADVLNFVELAQELDLYILLRPSAYICAEIDNGGLPYWLFQKYPNIKMRTSDEDYEREVKQWMDKLLPMFVPYMHGRNGGKIIMVQIENEYGVFECDTGHLEFLRDETLRHVGDSVLLFTTDIPDANVKCGTVENVYATIDFGAERAISELDDLWSVMRTIQPKGPLVNSEFYTGWLTYWQEENQIRSPAMIASALDAILKSGASVNLYMIYGGTNFGFTSGANAYGIGGYKADITSYDYDAPITEAGDPTEKLSLIREVIQANFPVWDIPVLPAVKTKMKLPDLILAPIELLLSDNSRTILGSTPVIDVNPKSFEQLNQFSGFVLYETEIPDVVSIDPTQLIVNGLHDRGQVFVDGIFVGTLSRENLIHSLPIHLAWGTKLQILVENQGRINYGELTDTKGILGRVTLQGIDGELLELTGWTSTGFPFENMEKLKDLVTNAGASRVDVYKTGVLLDGPVIYYGEFQIANDIEIFDTWIDPSGWSKGVIFVNGFNLGRYWPIVGPQISMYVPCDFLRVGTNEIVVLELQKAVPSGVISFSDVPLWK